TRRWPGVSRAPVQAGRPQAECLSTAQFVSVGGKHEFQLRLRDRRSPTSRGKVTWEGKFNLMDAVGMASGFTTKAKVDHVLVISGGLADPTLKLVDGGGGALIGASSKTTSLSDA